MDQSEDIRTDLALEAQQLAMRKGADVPGVSLSEQDLGFGTLTRLKVESDVGAQVMGKSKGTYVTIQVPDFYARRRELETDVSKALAKVIEEYLTNLGIAPSQPVLIVGLGNWNATPDNVGPSTTSKLLVTRHLHEYKVLSEEVLGRMRPVAALSPGVLGLTGVETAEIIHGVVQRTQPALVICIDALASMSVERLGTTIQISDVGINPGSGVGNKRMGLTRETLGVPVMAIGVPTVIYATTIVSDALDSLSGQSPLQGPQAQPGQASQGQPPSPIGAAGRGSGNPPANASDSILDPNKIVLAPDAQEMTQSAPRPAVPMGGPQGRPVQTELTQSGVGALDPAERRAVVRKVLGESMGNLVVTPKDIDVIVEMLSDVLADGLNEALHPGISAEEAAQLR